MNGWLVRPPLPVPYAAGVTAMRDLAEARTRGEVPDLLLLVEHPPVYTCGRRTDPSHVMWSRDRMAAAGAEIHEVDRGGSVTFHGPGQLVGYPILDLGRRPDLPAYLHRVEEVVIRAVADVGVAAERDTRQAGVWIGDRKVCAIGVRLMRWRITLHGFGLNCDVDPSWFDAIVPCGLTDRGVTTLAAAAGRPITVADVAPPIVSRFEEVFDLQLEPAPSDIADRFGSSTAMTAATVGRPVLEPQG